MADVEIPDNFEVSKEPAATLQSVSDKVGLITKELKEIKGELSRIGRLETKSKKSQPKGNRTAKTSQNSVVPALVEKLSACVEFKNKLSEIDADQTKLFSVLAYELFLKRSDNNIKIFSNGKFAHNNIFNFSLLDTLGFEKLSERLYGMIDAYRTKYVNDIMHNMSVPEFDFSSVSENLTSDFSNAVNKDSFKHLLQVFPAINTTYSEVPKRTLFDLQKFTGIDVDTEIIPHDTKNLKVKSEDVKVILSKCKESLRSRTRKLFFSYVSLDALTTLYDFAKKYDTDLDDLSDMYHKVNGLDDIVVVLSFDLKKLIALCRKQSKAAKEREEAEGDASSQSEEEIILDKQTLKNINENIEKSLEIYAGFVRKTLRYQIIFKP